MAEVYLGVGIDATGAKTGATQYDNASHRVASGAKRAAAANQRLQQQITYAKVALVAFAAVVSRQVYRVISDYTSSLSAAQAVTGATAVEMQQLERVTRELGATTMFSASQAAEGVKFLGMAGFETAEIVSAMPDVLNLAAAGALGLGEAADISSNIMSGFGIEAENMSEVADVLAVTASSANTNIQQLGEAMKFVAPVAKSIGVTMEDTAAAIGILANNGIQGSMAGTGLRRAMSALLKPTSQAESAVREMGLSIAELNPQTRQFNDIIRDLANAGMNAEQAFRIFGQRGATAVLALTSNTEELEKLAQVTNNTSGEAQEMADIMRDNLAGDAEILKSALSELALAIGDAGAEGAIRGFLQTSTQWVGSLSDSVKAISENEEQMRLLRDAFELVKNAVMALIALKLASWFETAAIASKALLATLVAHPYIAIGTAVAGLTKYLYDMREETKLAEAQTREMEQALIDMGGAAGEAARRTEIAMLQIRKAQMRTEDQIRRDIAERTALIERTGMTTSGAVSTEPFTGGARSYDNDAILNSLRAEQRALRQTESKITELAMKKLEFGETSAKSYAKARQAAEEYAYAAMGMATQVPTMAEQPTAVGQPSTMSAGQSELVQQATETIEQQSKAFWGVKDAVSSTNEDFKKYLEHNQNLVDAAATSLQQERKRNELLLEHGGNIQIANREMAIWLEQQRLDNYGREESAEKIRAQMEETQKLKDANKELAQSYTEEQRRVQRETEAYQRSQEQWTNSLSYAFKDAIMNSKNLGDALSNLANRVQSLLVNKAVDSLIGGLLGGMFAKGAAFKAGGVTAFASGGVVSSPTLFPMSNNRTGLMGEAGPEAVMPLARTSSGDLGVRAVGGSNTVVAPVFNIKVEGGSREQNEDAANRVSNKVMKALDDKVMKVIIREKRSGGVLSGS